MTIEEEYQRICEKSGFIPSEFKAPDFKEEDDSWTSPFSVLTASEIDFLYKNGFLVK